MSIKTQAAVPRMDSGVTFACFLFVMHYVTSRKGEPERRAFEPPGMDQGSNSAEQSGGFSLLAMVPLAVPKHGRAHRIPDLI